MTTTFWHSVRRFGRLWGFAAFLVLVLVLARRTVTPFFLAALLSYVLAPVVQWLTRLRAFGRTMPRFAAVVVVYVVILSSLALFFSAFLPRLSGDFARLFRGAPGFFATVKTSYVPRMAGWVEANFPSEDADDPESGPRPERKIEIVQTRPGHWDVSLEGVELAVEPLGGKGSGRWIIGPREDASAAGRFADFVANLVRGAESEAMGLLKFGQRFIAGVVKGVASLILIFMVAAFLLVDIEGVHRFLRGLVPAVERSSYDAVLKEIDRGLAGVIRGQLLICLVNGVLTYLGLVILKVKFALLLGMLAAAMSLIPVFGSILSSIPIVAVALVGGGAFDLKAGLAVLGWIIGIHLLEANLLNPKIIGDAAKIHPVVVIFALVVGEASGGLVGALMAVPVASVIQTLFVFFRRRAEEGAAAAQAPSPSVESA